MNTPTPPPMSTPENLSPQNGAQRREDADPVAWLDQQFEIDYARHLAERRHTSYNQAHAVWADWARLDTSPTHHDEDTPPPSTR